MNSPWLVPSWELSKNVFGQVPDKNSEFSPTSKNLLLGDSNKEFFGEPTTFWGVSRNLLGGLRRREGSVVLQWPRLVGVQGDPGLSISGLAFAFSLMALLFHFDTSAA